MQELMRNGITMTSRELAEITGKEHSHVMRDIRCEIESLAKEGINTESIFGLVEYTDAKGEARPMYSFGRDGAMQISMRYSASIRRKVILRLEELEKKTSLAIPRNYIEALKH